MEIIILVFVIAIMVGFLFGSLALHFATKILKVENVSYKKALKITIILFLLTTILAVVLGIMSTVLNVPILKSKILLQLLGLAAGFFIANVLYKKYYSTDLKKNLKIYITQILFAVVLYFLFALIVIVPLRIFIVQPFFMTGSSMEPNISNNAYTILKMYDKNYQRGEIVAHKNPKDEKQFFLKRIVGLPGEKIEISDGNVKINGSILNESAYLSNEVVTKGNINIQLGNEEYFVLGDNRGSSFDSRAWGPLNKSLIVGKFWKRLY